MKLITEQTFHNIEFLTEEPSTEDGQKRLWIEGVYMQANTKNRNGRIYEDKILRPAVDKFIEEQVKTNRALGECEHPQSAKINADRVSHRITELSWNGDNVNGKALILNTPMGNIVKGLIEGGTQIGVSSRGMGSLTERDGTKYVGNDFSLATIDVVLDPSAPAAWVNGILEGVEFIYDSQGNLIQTEAENYHKKQCERIRQAARKANANRQLIESQIKEFDRLVKFL